MPDVRERAPERRDRLAVAVGIAIASMKGLALLALAWWLLR